jgi:hypothetical protein
MRCFMKKFLWFSPLAFALTLGACSQAAEPTNIGKEGCSPLDYKNGVLYFPCVEDAFGNGLSNYLQDHPDLEVTSMSGDGTGSSGYDHGYFVIMKLVTDKSVGEE